MEGRFEKKLDVWGVVSGLCASPPLFTPCHNLPGTRALEAIVLRSGAGMRAYEALCYTVLDIAADLPQRIQINGL